MPKEAIDWKLCEREDCGTLDNEAYFVRRQVARALGKIGPAAKSAVPALEALLDDPKLGPIAERALEKITGE